MPAVSAPHKFLNYRQCPGATNEVRLFVGLNLRRRPGSFQPLPPMFATWSPEPGEDNTNPAGSEPKPDFVHCSHRAGYLSAVRIIKTADAAPWWGMVFYHFQLEPFAPQYLSIDANAASAVYRTPRSLPLQPSIFAAIIARQFVGMPFDP